MFDIASSFPSAGAGVYLNTASMALGNRPAAEALAVALDQWQRGTFDFVAAEQVAEELRSRVAGLLGASPSEIAFVTGASGAASTVAAQLRAGSSGANVVVPARDFLSNFMAWAMLRDRGYELRLVGDTDGVLSPDAFASAADLHTAVIATSLVQSASGFRVDVDALKSIAKDTGAWLVVDASQALGSVRVDAEGISALFSCSHKWLLGVRGIGYLYVDPALSEAFVPLTPGWKSTQNPTTSFYGPDFKLANSASKLDSSFGWFDAIANNEGLRIIEGVGIDQIGAHNNSLIDELEARGVDIPFDGKQRSPIASIKLDDPEKAVRNLGEGGITASVRAGNLRVSMHLYNTSDDVAALTEAIS